VEVWDFLFKDRRIGGPPRSGFTQFSTRNV
jgi:hypothetical protein